MYSLLAIVQATYGEVVRRPVYTIVLLLLSLLILLSPTFTLFSFAQEINMVREMGVASLALFGFIVSILLSNVIVTSELEDRTAITLLSKPLKRSHFLLGKFLGLYAALAMGIFFLGLVLAFTLWTFFDVGLLYGERFDYYVVGKGMSIERYIGDAFLQFGRHNGWVTIQGAFLSLLGAGIIAALSVSLAAFFPVVASAATTALLFILGNLSGYMLGALERSNSRIFSVLGRSLYYLIPNFGYFNLQTFYSEGKLLSSAYLVYAGAYALGYMGLVLSVSCTFFERRELR